MKDDLIDAWDNLRTACERVETSLPSQISKNVDELSIQWRLFHQIIITEARKQ